MTRERIRLVISDFHMGAGATLPDGRPNYLEDFQHDSKLVEFLEYYHQKQYAKAQIELIINGDFFNQLQVYPDEPHPTLMSEQVALRRTKAIIDGHPEVFSAMQAFAAAPNHSITFLIGNHDIGLLWPAVQQLLPERLGESVRVHPDPVYHDDGIWIEHGNQRVAENRIDFEHPFLENGDGDPIINMPWGNLFVVSFLNKVKRQRPYIDKVFPFRMYLRWAFIHDTWFALKACAVGLTYFLGVLLGIGENRRFSRQEFFKIAKEFSFPVKMDRAAKRLFALHPELSVIVFGHGHRAVSKQVQEGKAYFNTGIWNEMTSLDISTMGLQLFLTFVEIHTDRKTGAPNAKLRIWKGTYREVEDA